MAKAVANRGVEELITRRKGAIIRSWLPALNVAYMVGRMTSVMGGIFPNEQLTIVRWLVLAACSPSFYLPEEPSAPLQGLCGPEPLERVGSAQCLRPCPF